MTRGLRNVWPKETPQQNDSVWKNNGLWLKPPAKPKKMHAKRRVSNVKNVSETFP